MRKRMVNIRKAKRYTKYGEDNRVEEGERN